MTAHDAKPNRCPACGQANQCVMTQPGASIADCWCSQPSLTCSKYVSKLPPTLPADQCLCAQCLASFRQHKYQLSD
ncbi:MAG: cysteine-rich CWC family protein [Pseudomonadales bacterium]|nr:cysteine-rich CWC family protein [Pseudomonadales bacterium]